MPDFSSIETAIEAIRNGKMVMVVDDMSEEAEGNLIMAAELITPADVNFMNRSFSSNIPVCALEPFATHGSALPSMRSAGLLPALPRRSGPRPSVFSPIPRPSLPISRVPAM